MNRPGTIPLRERRSLGEDWEEFASKILKPMGVRVGSVQYVETRRAFYAGATAMMSLMTDLDPEKEPTDLDVAWLQSVHEELKQFARDVGAGKA
jgi:hypothetical protein